MDVLSEILNHIKLRGTVYFVQDFSAPWGMQVPQSNYARFHAVIQGECHVSWNNNVESQRMQAGEWVLFPHGLPHRLLDQPESSCMAGEEVIEAHQQGQSLFEGKQNSKTSKILCGHFEFKEQNDSFFLNDLPEKIFLKSEPSKSQGLSTVLHLIESEIGNSDLGANLSMDKLSELLFIQMLRVYISQGSVDTGLLSALEDERLGYALKLIHTNPADAWSVERLAKAVGISRSQFAFRFKECLGISPMNYLTRWRLELARERIQQSNEPIESIAFGTGYESEASFYKAFKKHFERNPGDFRRSRISSK